MVSPTFITSLTFLDKNLVKIVVESAKNQAIKYSLGPVRTHLMHYLCVIYTRSFEQIILAYYYVLIFFFVMIKFIIKTLPIEIFAIIKQICPNNDAVYSAII